MGWGWGVMGWWREVGVRRVGGDYISCMRSPSEGSGVQRMAHFEDQVTGQTQIVRLTLFYQCPPILNLSLSFQRSGLDTLLPPHAQIFYLNPLSRQAQYLGTFPFQQEVFIDLEPHSRHKLHFLFRNDQPPAQQPSARTAVEAGRKSRERTIGEVLGHLESVKRVYGSLEKGEMMTLQQAAEKVGLPKKTLDDYERQVRIARTLNFDFPAHRNSGMGVLRNFVRQQRASQGGLGQVQAIIEPDLFLDMGRDG